MGDHW
jgi:thymidine kinase